MAPDPDTQYFEVTTDAALSGDEQVRIHEDGPNGEVTYTYTPPGGVHTQDMMATGAGFFPEQGNDYWYSLPTYQATGIETSPAVYSVEFNIGYEEAADPTPDPTATFPVEVNGALRYINLYAGGDLEPAEESLTKFEVNGTDYPAKLLAPSESPVVVEENGTRYGLEIQ